MIAKSLAPLEEVIKGILGYELELPGLENSHYLLHGVLDVYL
jgi:hypothetical protein